MRKSSLFVIFGLLFAAYAAVPAPANAADAASGRPAAIANVIAATSSSRPALANMRAPNMSVAIPKPSIQATVSGPGHVAGGTGTGTGNGGAVTATPPAEKNSATCREAYRQCMDDFCLMDESEGLRCACSDNINASKSLIKSITDVQQQAEDLYTTGVEREKLGAQAMIVFGTGAKARSRGIDWSTWMNSGDSASLDSDQDIGDSLFAMAADGCKARLAACGPDADMEETLYSRMIANDCKHFSAFLKDQQKIANNNLAAGQKAVRAARTSMLATTNKYNRGECLLALKSCIATKGGCGDNFENCLDASLLARRTKACDNILDQCMYTRDEVLDDWAAESKRVLADAAKYADMNKRNTCLARIRACLSDNCSASYDVKNATDSACLTNVNIAAGICPIITECNTLVPGLKNVIGDQLAYLRVQFCQNDIDKCLQDKCGADYTAPECLGKRTAD
ncbi:MAG: hypothetical protein FWC61_01145, partial [Proteobacteria bacterium]|nr:hypothetical protein [Pseudomonadota bacterium]